MLKLAVWAEVKKRKVRRKEEMERPILRKTGSVVEVTSVGVVTVVYAEMGKGFT